MNITLAKAIADLAVFLEFSGEEVVDPDAAVGAMEQLASTLLQMNTADRSSFSAVLHGLAGQYEDTEVAAFVGALPETLGLAD